MSLARFFVAAKEIERETHLRGSPFGIPGWVTIENALVGRIDEQYFP
ncbi:MAG: hypothetical protein ABI896_08360 [Actinomycetota bacterium]